MSALDDKSFVELERLESKYYYDTTGFLREVQTAIKRKQMRAAKKAEAEGAPV